MDKLVRVVAMIGVNHGPLANGLKAFVHTFQFDHLITFLEETENVLITNLGEKG